MSLFKHNNILFHIYTLTHDPNLNEMISGYVKQQILCYLFCNLKKICHGYLKFRECLGNRFWYLSTLSQITHGLEFRCRAIASYASEQHHSEIVDSVRIIDL